VTAVIAETVIQRIFGAAVGTGDSQGVATVATEALIGCYCSAAIGARERINFSVRFHNNLTSEIKR
jgi:hypothetical protein